MPHADEHLAAFCTTLPELRAAVTRQGLGRVLDDVLARVRAGHPPKDELPRLGIPADVLRGSDLVPPVPGRTFGEVYVCPSDACGREVPREPGGPVPAERCWLRDEPLRRERA
ncbi:hypothetical protein [Saccharothrix stipae]